MQVKCTSCGASQNISQAQCCDFCGNLIELESAKSNYQKAMQSENGNLMTMAETAIEATNWEEALQFFNQVLIKDITNSDAWLGKGIAIVYTSKIGDLKINEAIAYWKNALKHSTNQEAMGKRVAKEINDVVNKFYPYLEKHFIQFKDLDNSYGELVDKFVVLEKAIDYATQLYSNIKYYETGFALCSRVIQIPKEYALADEGAAWAQGMIGAVQNNKYKIQDAVQARQKAVTRKQEIQAAANIVRKIELKYLVALGKIDPDTINIIGDVFEINYLQKGAILNPEEVTDRINNGSYKWRNNYSIDGEILFGLSPNTLDKSMPNIFTSLGIYQQASGDKPKFVSYEAKPVFVFRSGWFINDLIDNKSKVVIELLTWKENDEKVVILKKFLESQCK